MPEYRRVIIKGGVYFFTIVTYERQKIFLLPEVRALFSDSLDHIQKYHPFIVIAYCILPDHVHFIWQMPENDANYSMRISQIKRRFSMRYILQFGTNFPKTESRQKRREVMVWQRRFWEHYIRDEEDLNKHIDYIHYNPVKHGVVDVVRDWNASSFHDYVRQGYYELDWGEEYEDEVKPYQFGD